jgi:fatty acid desaturase
MSLTTSGRAEEIAAATSADAFYSPPSTPGLFDRVARRFINDPRDVPFLRLMVTASLCVFPLAGYLFYRRTFPWWFGAIHLAIVFLVFVDRFILMLHNTSHRALFKRKYGVLNLYIPWVLGPFMGESPETYFAHHVGMHHPENNLEEDLSSTMPYRRDSFLHFLRYFGRFMTTGLGELTLYLARNNRRTLMRRMLVGELGFYAVIAALMFYSPEATFFVFLAPLLIVRFLMMCGNWGQHAFIDPQTPENSYRNSITCIDSRYNRRCFNDGYHIGHHLKATMHWTEMPAELSRNRGKYAQEKAIVFRNTDFFMVWLMLVTKRYGALADHYVHLGDGPAPGRDEIIATLKQRVQPIIRAARIGERAAA